MSFDQAHADALRELGQLQVASAERSRELARFMADTAVGVAELTDERDRARARLAAVEEFLANYPECPDPAGDPEAMVVARLRAILKES